MRASGSSAAAGSSRISSSGRFAAATVRASWARWPPESRPGLLGGGEADLRGPPFRQAGVPGRVEPGAHAEVVGDGERGVDGRVLGDETDLGQVVRVRGGPGPEHAERARRRCDQPAGQLQQGGLAGPVGTDQTDDPAPRHAQLSSRSGPCVCRTAWSGCRRPAPESRDGPFSSAGFRCAEPDFGVACATAGPAGVAVSPRRCRSRKART